MTFRFLASYHFHRKSDLSRVVVTTDGGYELFADSGAYSAFASGAVIDLADYSAWLKDWRDLITTASTLDVIGDHLATERNTEILREHGHEVIPTFHTGSPWPVLEDLCSRNSYVALGGMVPYASRPDTVRKWLIRCFLIGREHGAVFHGFGQTNMKILRDLPFYSVDSTSWCAGAQYGFIKLWDDRAGHMLVYPSGDPAAARRGSRLLRDHGLDPRRVGQPGFAVQSKRSKDQFRAEYDSLRGGSAVAFYRAGEWLTGRHHVQPPPDLSSQGTKIFLADTTISSLINASRTVIARR